jgi:uncharacterized protein
MNRISDKSNFNSVYTYIVDNNYYFYDANTGTLLKSNKLTNLILNYMKTISVDEIIKKLKGTYDLDLINEKIDEINVFCDKGLFSEYKFFVDDIEKMRNKENYSNLWLNISHNCNLRCVYCYGHGGNYRMNTSLMTVENAKKYIDYWFERFNKESKRATVTFFGGEPLMNFETLKFSIDYIKNILKSYNVKINFTLTTNGTIMNDEIIKLFKENRINPLISIDGGKIIQDNNRPYNSGKGSFNDIKKNIKKLKKHYNNLGARLTLTKKYTKNLKEAVIDLWEMGFTRVRYDIVSLDDKEIVLDEDDFEDLKNQIDDLASIFYEGLNTDKKRILSNFYKPIQYIKENNSSVGCTLYGNTGIIFTPEGNMYKCQRLVDNEDYCVGNINNGIDWNKNNNIMNVKIPDKCRNCFIKKTCNLGCAQINITFNGDKNEPYSLWCEHSKYIFKKSFAIYAKLLDNNKLESIFIRR